MAGAATTKIIRDGNAAAFNGREWDESGTGGGPYSSMPVLGDGAGAALKVETKAAATLSTATLASAGNSVYPAADLDAARIVRLDAPLGDLTNGTASNNDGTSTALIGAAGSGVRVYLTDVTLTNTSATNIYVEMKDGTTTRWVFPVPANSGVTHHFRSPLGGTANTAWNFDPSAAATTVWCSAAGFKSKI